MATVVCGALESDLLGAPLYTPWVCMPLSGLARARDVPGECKQFLMATVVCGARGRGACMGNFGNFWEILGIFERGMGAPLYTPWACMPLSGMVRAKDVPQ